MTSEIAEIKMLFIVQTKVKAWQPLVKVRTKMYLVLMCQNFAKSQMC